MNPKYMNLACLVMAILMMALWRDTVATALCLLASGMYAAAFEIRGRVHDKAVREIVGASGQKDAELVSRSSRQV